ncbi:hypothetical protein SESBI_22992 [Sesbania bispinosa]|nr:hypothetical protein SESBI_22992 [Sesbania bispinosa]
MEARGVSAAGERDAVVMERSTVVSRRGDDGRARWEPDLSENSREQRHGCGKAAMAAR